MQVRAVFDDIVTSILRTLDDNKAAFEDIEDVLGEDNSLRSKKIRAICKNALDSQL